MSSIHRIKKDIRSIRAQQGGRFNVYRDMHTNEEDKVVVLPFKPKSKEKLMDVEKEARKTQSRNSKRSSGPGKRTTTPMDVIRENKNENDSSDEEEEEKEEKKRKIKKIPWGPKEILENLDNPEVVLALDELIIPSLLKKTPNEGQQDEEKKEHEIIVWDHGETKQGKQSDNNFFLWLEAYASFRCKEKKEEENRAFN